MYMRKRCQFSQGWATVSCPRDAQWAVTRANGQKRYYCDEHKDHMVAFNEGRDTLVAVRILRLPEPARGGT